MSDRVDDAADLVRQSFPTVRWAVLGGSVITAARTAGSDLDVVVLLDEADGDAAYVRSLQWQGWPVELFVYTEASLDWYVRENVANRRPTLPRLVAGSVTVAGSDAEAQRWRDRCAAVLADGPPEPTREALDAVRYRVTDLLDDLIHVTDAGEEAVLTAVLWLAVAELAFDAANHWRGGGKWIARELRDLDPELARQWLDTAGNPRAVAGLARAVLEDAGGPLFNGHLRQGRPNIGG